MSGPYDTVTSHDFSLIPRAEIPRSRFKMRHTHKTTFDAGYLIPVYCEEMLPGDVFRGSMHAVARLITPITPFMDDLTLESFFFFTSNRLVFDNWKKLNGEQKNPGDSTSYILPTMTSPAGGYAVNSLHDYFGLPTVGQVAGGNTVTHQSLPLRMHNLIYNEWFRDENLINSATVDTGAGPDTYSNHVLRRRGKRHDYFTSCLPWPQKGTAVSLPLGTSANVVRVPSAPNPMLGYWIGSNTAAASGAVTLSSGSAFQDSGGHSMNFDPQGSLVADLSTATAATINSIRLAFQTQRLLERDARGGTRYTEIILSHFGVKSPDARQQRPEYIGGGSTPIVINGVVQTSSTPIAGGGAGTPSTPLANLAATGTMISRGGHDFSYSATEHGYVIGLINVRGENTYQQGMRRHWSRSTRFDFYLPVFQGLGEQAVLNKEIYCDGSANDSAVFGYQERWGEYRTVPSQLSGLFRSTSSGTLDIWHLAQKFASLPTLNQTFIEENPPVDRVNAVSSSVGKQFLIDMLFEVDAVRPLPAYGVPGLIDHF